MVGADTDPGTATFADTEIADVPVGVLEVVEGPDVGVRHEFASDRALIGSAEQADLCLQDRTVSRLHAEVSRQGDFLVLRDLGSKNGTWLAGVRVRELVLQPGVSVRIGASMVRAWTDVRRSARQSWSGPDQFGGLYGGSPAMHQLFARASQCAASDSTVLIVGEPGTGKEVLARVIHDHSRRASGPWIVLDCGALATSMADLEFFGHERGAFTGADRERPGVFERADGGTLLLDGVDALAPELQPKLLRALELGEVKRIGGGEYRRVDVRIVASTTVRLEERVNEHRFREDLLQRLAVLELRMPPLRERGRDVFGLARELATQAGYGSDDMAALEQELERKRGYTWPGNVRELQAFVRRFGALGPEVAEQFGPPERLAVPSLRVDLPYREAKDLYVRRFEQEYARQLLDECGGNLSEAARRARMNRSAFHELVRRSGIER